jgi:transketolase
VLFDDNHISIDGDTALTVSDDQQRRFAASGWHVQAVDGHDHTAVAKAIEAALAVADKPSMIACRTTIGYGAPTKQGKASTHGEPLGEEEIKGAREKLGWSAAPFEIPADVLAAWRAAGTRGKSARTAWERRYAKLDGATRKALEQPSEAAAAAVESAIQDLKRAAAGETTKKATRAWSQIVLDKLVPALPALIGGSADLSGSNNTRAKSMQAVGPGSFAGNYIHYGVREHAMAAIMNGLALHGGLIPYGGTFLVFADYARPAIRLSALMGQRVIYVMTHDSIGLGEDGPTHQPVEHLAALRAIPNLNVFRPADGVETAECWQLAVAAGDTPSVFALTRQAVANVRTEHTAVNRSAKGGYVLRAPAGSRAVTLIATGSEVEVALTAADLLAKDGIAVAVVSMPCMELFRGQPAAYQAEVLGEVPRVAVEAAVAQGWHEWLRPGDGFVGMSGFGASAPAPKLYEHFRITPAAVAERARALAASAR